MADAILDRFDEPVRALFLELERRTGATIVLEAQDDALRFEVMGVPGEYQRADLPMKIKLGYFRVAEVTLGAVMMQESFGRFPSDCRRAWEKTGKKPLWVVRGSEWFDPSLRRKGLGKMAYRILIEYALGKGGVVGPDRCGGGSTSLDAEHVWDSLCGDYECVGPLISGVRRR